MDLLEPQASIMISREEEALLPEVTQAAHGLAAAAEAATVGPRVEERMDLADEAFNDAVEPLRRLYRNLATAHSFHRDVGAQRGEDTMQLRLEVARLRGTVLALAWMMRPQHFILENVLGCKRPRSATIQSTPLDWYNELCGQELEGYSWADCVVDAWPHPEARKRVFILGSCSGEFTAEAWTAQVLELQDRAATMPMRRYDVEFSAPRPPAGLERVDEQNDIVDYHVLFANAFKLLGMCVERCQT